MNYSWLFSFVVFAEQLNFTRAAATLYITQPALHGQIRKLTEQVGTALYRRRGRALVLTPEGKRLAAFGREVRLRGQDVLAEIHGGNAQGPTVLSSGRGALRYLLGPAIRRYPKQRWPLRVLTKTGPETLDAVRDARVDVGVAVIRTDCEGVTRTELRRVGQRVVIHRSHPLAKRRKLRPEHLHDEPLVLAPRGSPHRTMLEHAFASAGARLSVGVEAAGWDLMLQFCRYGLGIAVVNEFCEVPRGYTGIRLEGVPDVTYSVLTRPGTLRPSAEALMNVVLSATAA
ncbi:MAG: LysR family transcriptional regulator [Myxococcota bacterium]